MQVLQVVKHTKDSINIVSFMKPPEHLSKNEKLNLVRDIDFKINDN